MGLTSVIGQLQERIANETRPVLSFGWETTSNSREVGHNLVELLYYRQNFIGYAKLRHA